MCDEHCITLQNLNICSAYYACEAFRHCICKEHNQKWNKKREKFFEFYRQLNFDVANKMDCSPHNIFRYRFSEAKSFEDIQNLFDTPLQDDVDLSLSLLENVTLPIEQLIVSILEKVHLV